MSTIILNLSGSILLLSASDLQGFSEVGAFAHFPEAPDQRLCNILKKCVGLPTFFGMTVMY